MGSDKITAGMAMVDAHTGEVRFGFSDAIHIGVLNRMNDEGLRLIVVNGRTIYPYSKALLVNGRVYVPVKWLFWTWG